MTTPSSAACERHPFGSGKECGDGCPGCACCRTRGDAPPESRDTKHDPTYGRIDPDIQRVVDEWGPRNLGQRVAVENTMQQRRNGGWEPAVPIGWQEEHNWLARLVFWLRGIEHCNDREGQRRRRVR